jgi:hypothetical protein
MELRARARMCRKNVSPNIFCRPVNFHQILTLSHESNLASTNLFNLQDFFGDMRKNLFVYTGDGHVIKLEKDVAFPEVFIASEFCFFHKRCQHNDCLNIFFDHHVPKLFRGSPLRSLSGDVLSRLMETLPRCAMLSLVSKYEKK